MAKRISKEDIKELSNEELVQRIEEERQRYRQMRFNHTVSPLDDTNILKFLRRDIARLITENKKRQTANEQQ